MTEIYKGNMGSIVYYGDKKFILFTFHGFVNLEEAKKMYLEVLQFMKNHKTRAFINDLRMLKGTFTALNNWLIEHMKPAVQMGLKYDAIVVNSDIFTSFAVDDLIKKVSVIEIQLFST